MFNHQTVNSQSISAEGITYASTENGRVYRWGYTAYNYGSDFPEDISNRGAFAGKKIVLVSSGSNNMLALTDDGRVIYFEIPEPNNAGGFINETEPILIEGISDVVDIEAEVVIGGYLLKADGSLYTAWPTPQKVEGVENVIAISSSSSLLMIKSDSTVHTLSGQIPGLSKVVAISTSSRYSLALKSDGTVWAWGYNGTGQLGNGTYEDSDIPVQAVGLKDVVAIEAGLSTSYALKADGSVYAWGDGSVGQLGDGISFCPYNEVSHYVPLPTKIQKLNKIKIISSKSIHAHAMDEEGKVYGWGYDYFHETGTEEGYYDLNDCVSTPSLVKNLRLIERLNLKPGVVNWQQWTSLPVGGINTIPVYTNPNKEALLNVFETGLNIGTNYGSRIRGYVKPTQTGKYVFYIASDDYSELWLSSNSDPSKKVKIASVTRYTSPRDWYKFASQKSKEIDLVAGELYYIEALHKENSGFDHMAVAWRLPDGTFEGPIPGERLAAYLAPENISPTVTASVQYPFYTPIGVPVEITATAMDVDGVVEKVEYYLKNIKIGEDLTSPYQITLDFPEKGYYSFTIKATDNEGGIGVFDILIDVYDESDCNNEGFVEREKWTNVSAGNLSTVPFNTPATSTQMLYKLEAPSNEGNYYGSRIRGYICAPMRGNYTFYIASDDYSELWFSPTPITKYKIASVEGYTGVQQWDKYPSQKSSVQYLYAGHTYYFEILHKENAGFDHVSVAWKLPNGTFEGPIPGKRLSPYGMPDAASMARIGDIEELVSTSEFNSITAYPNPFTNDVVVQFTSTEAGNALMSLYDLNGKLIKKLYEGTTESGGSYEIQVSTQQMLSGIYICRLEQDGKVVNIKLIKI